MPTAWLASSAMKLESVLCWWAPRTWLHSMYEPLWEKGGSGWSFAMTWSDGYLWVKYASSFQPHFFYALGLSSNVDFSIMILHCSVHECGHLSGSEVWATSTTCAVLKSHLYLLGRWLPITVPVVAKGREVGEPECLSREGRMLGYAGSKVLWSHWRPG